MKEKTKELLDKVEEAHDWAHGRTYSSGGDVYSSTDICRVCGLRRAWNSGSKQNDIPASTTFFTMDGRKLTLREAAGREC